MEMPTLYLICGLPGAGKTTLARRLEAAHSAIRFCPDEWISKIIENNSDKAELDRLRNPVEELQWNTAKSALAHGVNVILENGFWSKEERDQFLSKGKSLGARVELHFLDIPLDELIRRLESRNRNLPENTFKVSADELRLWTTWFEAPDAAELDQYDHCR